MQMTKSVMYNKTHETLLEFCENHLVYDRWIFSAIEHILHDSLPQMCDYVAHNQNE